MSRSNSKGRNLRLLVVNDEENVPVTVEPLDLVSCPNPFEATEQPRLGTWMQHLWMWMRQEVPEFDLLLVDIRFYKDTTDPKYFDERANPLGLLHVLPLVGQLTTSKMPFVWGIHSSAKEAVIDDPIAIVCYGLLRAMDHANQPDQDLESEFAARKPNLSRYFKEKLQDDQSVTNTPDTMVRSLVVKYRKAFLLACRDKLSLNYGQLDLIARLASDYAQGDVAAGLQLADACIVVSNGVMTDEISVRSYFGDLSDWSPENARQVVQPELQALQNTQPFTDIWSDVRKCISQLQGDNNEELTAGMIVTEQLRGNDQQDRHGRVSMGLVLCACLRLLHDQWRGRRRAKDPPQFQSSDVLKKLGYPPGQYKWPDYRLKDFFGKSMRLTNFRDQLDQQPLGHAFLRECGRRYWQQLNQEHETELRLPACLVDPVAY